MSNVNNKKLRYHQQFTKAFSLVLLIVSILALVLLIDIANDGTVVNSLTSNETNESTKHLIAALLSDYVAFVFATAVGLAGAFVAITIAKNTEILQNSANKLQEQANQLSSLIVKHDDPAYHDAYYAVKKFKLLVFTAQAIVTTDQISIGPKGELIAGPLRSSVHLSEEILSKNKWIIEFLEADFHSPNHDITLELLKEARYRIDYLHKMLAHHDAWILENKNKISEQISLYALAVYGLFAFLNKSIRNKNMDLEIEPPSRVYLQGILEKNPVVAEFLVYKVRIELLHRLTGGGWFETSRSYFERQSIVDSFANRALFVAKPTNDNISFYRLSENIYGSALSIHEISRRDDIIYAINSMNENTKVLLLKLNLTTQLRFESHPDESLLTFFDKAFDSINSNRLKGKTIALVVDSDLGLRYNFYLDIYGLISSLDELNNQLDPDYSKIKQYGDLLGIKEDFSKHLSVGLIITTSNLADGLNILSTADIGEENAESPYDFISRTFQRPVQLIQLPQMLL